VNRTARVRMARAAGLLVVAVAVIPSAGAAHAAVAAVQPAAEATPYADQVAVGPATKIGNPDAGRSRKGVSTPAGATVVETDSRQNAQSGVAVLGTKIGAPTSTLASTGPSKVSTEALIAAALIALGAALRGSPAMWDAAHRAAVRRH